MKCDWQNMNLRLRSLALITCLGVLFACATARESNSAQSCAALEASLDWTQQIAVLDTLSLLFEQQCYEASLRVGQKVRDKFQHKHYSLIKESAELFMAEGTVTDYVLESYERGYLSFLITLSYLKLGRTEELTSSLNRFYNEELALTYNHGQDPVNALLQAVLWENFPQEGYSARPFWLWISRSAEATLELKQFAQQRVDAMDAKAPLGHWEIHAVGRFPALDWKMSFEDAQHGYIAVKPKIPFLELCRGRDELMVPVSTWFHKIAMRHSHDYHPLVHAKSWIRLPFGLAYGVTTVAAGASVMVGGCALDLGSKGDGAFCKVSIEGGAAIMAKSDDVMDYVLKPDLRHWQRLPSAIYIRQTNATRQCDPKAKDLVNYRLWP